MLAGRFRPVQRPLALAPVEAAEVPARERHPVDAVAIDVAAARPVAGKRRLVHFGERGLRRVRARIDPHDVAGHRESHHRSPDRAVHRIHGDCVKVDREPPVLRGIVRLAGLDVRVALAVAVGVENERRPALRTFLVAGLLEHPAIQPADDAVAADAAARPERMVRVLGEDQVMRRKARADQRELARLRIVHGEMPRSPIHRETFADG